MRCDASQPYDSTRVSENPASVVSDKKAWIQRYAGRMFALWLERQTCLGVTRRYMQQLREDLAKWYDEPLRRMFIEATY
jgi:hypothetical protein